jgi:hypothetical protein
MRTFAPILLAVVGLGVAGCTQQQSSKNTFSGDEKDVAQVVIDLSDDARRGRQAEVCDQVLSARLQKSVAGDSSCISEVKKAFEDADAATIDVNDVTITGATATAAVSTKDRGEKVKRTFKLVREDRGWRIDSFG